MVMFLHSNITLKQWSWMEWVKEVIQVSRNLKCSEISFRVVQFCIILTQVGQILWYNCTICIMFCHDVHWYKVMTVKTVKTEAKEEQISAYHELLLTFKHLWDNRYVMPCHLCPILLCSTPQESDPCTFLSISSPLVRS